MTQFITHLRPARLADCQDIYLVHMHAVQFTCNHYYNNNILQAWTEKLSPDSYAQAMKDKDVWVIEYKNNIQGFFQLDLHTAELDALYVHPFVHHTGLGTAMLQRAEKIAYNANLSFLKLYASLNSILFYEINGYSSLGPCELRLNPNVTVKCELMRHTLVEDVR